MIVAILLIALPAGERLVGWLSPFPIERLRPYQSSVVVTDATGQVLRWADRADDERRRWVTLDQVSPHLRAALIAGEDRRFSVHSGVDALAVLRAAWTNAWHGRRTSGGSTVTMQVARLIEPAPRTWMAKLREAVRARQLERVCTKDEILEQYINRAPWGGRLRGIEAASQHWFGIAAADLAPAQAAMLVAMLPAPSRRSPQRAAALLRDRRDRILAAMPLSPAARHRAVAEPLPIQPHPFPWLAPHACDAALAAGARQGGTESLRLDLHLAEQEQVQAAVTWDRLPVDGIAIIVADFAGHIRVHLGSADWRLQPFDAARAQRAAGSTLKPFLYRQAFAQDALAPSSRVADQPLAISGWRPENEDERYLGALPAGEALWRSRNPPAVAALRAIGLAAFAEELHAVGLDLPVKGYDAALGTASVRPLDLARAYAALARAAFGGGPAAAVLDALRSRPLAEDLFAPGTVAWKTGTSSHRRDAWCVAITADRVVLVWLGRQDGSGDPHLRGREQARRVCGEVVVAVR